MGSKTGKKSRSSIRTKHGQAVGQTLCTLCIFYVYSLIKSLNFFYLQKLL